MEEEGFHNSVFVLSQSHVFIHFGSPGRKVEAAPLSYFVIQHTGRANQKSQWLVSKEITTTTTTKKGQQKLYQSISFGHIPWKEFGFSSHDISSIKL